MTAPVELRGEGFSLEELVAVSRRAAPVTVGEWSALEAGRAWLDGRVDSIREGRETAPIYGVTTGFGSLKNQHLDAADLEQAQVNLLRSHALGVTVPGSETFADDVVRAAMVLRANTFLAGRSAVRREVVELLVAMLNAGVHPVIPQRGSVGASGDLAPLSHLALVLIGEGQARVDDRCLSGAEALAEAGLEPVRLACKEGLALINGTAVSTACLALALEDAERLVRLADAACALSLEAIGGQGRALDPQVHAARGQVGQQDSAAGLRSLVRGSRRVSTTDDTQDVYSFRCAPQVHGASRDALSWVRLMVVSELSAITDNPLFFVLDGDEAPWDAREFADNPVRFGRPLSGDPSYSAGNFHGQPMAVAADVLALAVAELADISERRSAVLVDPRASRGLPSQLAVSPGLQSGLMLAQYVAASLASENKTLSHPASVDSIPTGCGAEDHVSMSTWAARKAASVVHLTARVLALELITAAQANDWRAIYPDPSVEQKSEGPSDPASAFANLADADVAAELGEGTAAVYRAVRVVVARVVEDRSLADEVEHLVAAMASGAVPTGETRPVRALRFD